MLHRRYTLLFAFLIPLAGCTPWATYPPIEGAVSFHNPALEPIPTLMAEAIGHVYLSDERAGELVINLPPDTPAKIYDRVIARLGDGRPMQTDADRAYHVYELRLRANEAEIDVIHPGNGGAPELLTLSFKQELFKGWQLKRTRRWRLHVEAPPPYYIPPPEELPPTPQLPQEDEQTEQYGPPAPEPDQSAAPEVDAVTRPT